MQGDVANMYIHVGILLLEIARLGWPEHFIGKSLCSLPRRHVSPLISACRQIGRKLRRCELIFLFEPCDLVKQILLSPVEASVHKDMSQQWRPRGGSQNWRPWGPRNYPNQQSDHQLSKEVVDFVREEQRRRAEERQTNEVQKQAKEVVLRMFGMSDTASSSSAAPLTQEKSQPFEMFSWVANKLKRKKPRQTSSSSSSGSSTWTRAKKKCEKNKSSKEKKEKKRKAEKSKTRQPRKLVAVTSSPKLPEESEQDLTKDRRLELVKNLKIEGKIQPDQLEAEDWKADVAHAAKKEDVQKLAEKNGIQKSGTKYEIIERLVTYMIGK